MSSTLRTEASSSPRSVSPWLILLAVLLGWNAGKSTGVAGSGVRLGLPSSVKDAY